VDIEPDTKAITTKLLVKWAQVADTLGSLALSQELFGLAALLYYLRLWMMFLVRRMSCIQWC